MDRPVVLVVDKNPATARETADALAERGVEVRIARGVSEAIQALTPILAEFHALRREAREAAGFAGFVGRNEVMARVRERLVRLAGSDGPVLLVGEPGTGKELAARMLHELSPRAAFPFVVADPRVFPAGAFEDEVFRPNGGLLDLAAGGTLYFREALDLAGPIHERLLRDHAAGRLHARLVGATSRDPRRACDEGRVSREFVGGFGTSILSLPPLRDRLDDVAPLAHLFVASVREINDLPMLRLEAAAVEALSRWRWPGNVRELRRVVEHAALLASDGVVRLEHFPEALRATPQGGTSASEVTADRPFRDAKRRVVEAFERAYLADLMRRHGGNVTSAASQSGMLRSALQRLLRKYALKSAVFREAERPVSSSDAS